jgi:hypothetical protein
MRSWTPVDVYRPIGSRNVLLYDGPSQLTGARILVIATAQNGNRKIGRMLQLWIVPAISPIAAVKSGADDAVCGDCRHRGDGRGAQRSCYVEYWRAVENIWQARAKALAMTPQAFAVRHPGLQLRIGAYGDPVAVPVRIWRYLLSTARGFTAYTHAWRQPQARAYQDFCMASVDTPLEQAEAAAAGWRTFRVRASNESLLDSEVACPASEEAGHRTVCAACELCQGARRGRVKHVAIIVHGSSAVHFTAARARTIALTEVPAAQMNGAPV